MSWARVKQTGYGRLRFRAVIAGNKYEMVSDVSLAGAGSDGRTRVPGLDAEGLSLSDSVDIAHARVTASGTTLRVVDNTRLSGSSTTPRWTDQFSRTPTHRTWLSAQMTDISASASVLSTAGFPSAGELWLDLECVHYTGVSGGNTFTGLTRGYRQTIPTYHYNTDTYLGRATEVDDWPISMVGRHVFLYVYGSGDDPTGDGTLIWTGIVASEPPLQEATRWEVGVDPLTRLLDQDLGGDLASDLGPSGIYYPYDACFYLAIFVSSDSTAANLPTAPTNSYKISGRFATQELFVAAVNVKIAASGAAAWLSCVCDGPSGFHFELYTPGASQKFVGLLACSAIDLFHCGGKLTAIDRQKCLLDTAGVPDTSTFTSVAAATRYKYAQFPISEGNVLGLPVPSGALAGGADTHVDLVQVPGSVPRGVWHSNTGGIPIAPTGGLHSPFVDSTASATAPARRIYIDGLGDIASIDNVLLHFGDTAVPYPVFDRDATTRYLETGDGEARSCAWAGTGPRIGPTRAYVFGGTLAAMKAQLIGLAAQEGPLGTAPLFDLSDLASWTAADTAAAGRRIAIRNYIFRKPVRLSEWLAEECKLIGVFPALTSTGTIALRQVGVAPTGTSWTIGEHQIVWQAGVPGYQRNPLGTLKAVAFSTQYDIDADEWRGPELIFRDLTASGRNPLAEVLKVQPKSIDAGVMAAATVMGLMTTVIPPTVWDEYDAAASLVLGLFGYPHDYITVSVPLTLWDAICGDTVAFTSRSLPSGSGTRGMSGRSAIIVARRWDLEQGIGTFTLLASEIDYAGYTHTSRVQSQVNTIGNTWQLTIATPAAGPTAGYSAASAWQNGWKVRVAAWNTTTSSVVVGSVSAPTSGSVVTVTFTAPWVPGASTWNLEFDVADSTTVATQQAYCYIAAADGTIAFATTRAARQLAP